MIHWRSILAAAAILILALAALPACRIPNRPLMNPSSEQHTAPTNELGSGLFFWSKIAIIGA